MIKQKEIRVCNYCGTELEDDYITFKDIPNEGFSEIVVIKKGRQHKTFYVQDGYDFCDINCLKQYLQDILSDIKSKKQQM